MTRGARLLSLAVTVVACTPAFHAGESDDDTARAGAGGATGGSAGHGATTSGTGGSAHAGSAGTAEPGTGGAGGSGARGGSNGSGGTSARGGSDSGTGGDDETGGTGGSGGTGAHGGTGAMGGRGGQGAQGGSEPQGGRDPLGGGAGAPGAGTSPGGTGNDGGRGGFLGLGGIGGGGLAGLGGAGGGTHTPCAPALVVDDMEDGDALTCPNQGRAGDWWTATGTPTGTINPPTQGNFPAYALGADARAGSSYGMRFAGTGFGHTDDDWASLGFYLAGEAAYDLTPYQGLAFYAKSKSGAFKLNVEFATNTTTPTGDGGTCTSDCTDHYKGVVTLDGTWQEYTVPFEMVKQEGWGVKPKDLAHTLFVYFGFLGTDGGPANFELLIDDVRLY